MSTYYCQGIYIPKHPEKYKGTTPICYRSAPERRLMIFADTNPNIIIWQSESVVIPYIKPTDGKVHKYFIDFTFHLKESNGHITKYIVEYKPFKQTISPIKSSRKSDKTFFTEQINYAVNMSKWKSAREFANANGYKFLIITEKELEAY